MLVHDLQGPLGNVVTSLEMIQTELDRRGDSSLLYMMDIAVRSSKQLQVLVDSLMDISRLEAGRPVTDLAPVAVTDLIDFVADVASPEFEERRVELVREISADLPLINGNADILQRVLLNLLNNALKVSKADQAITIRAAVEPGANEVRISILDQGPGVPDTHRERIFEKYQRLADSSSSKGLGLGLAFCRLAVESHGGRIWVEESPAAGACFCFTVPVADGPTLDKQS